MLLFQDGLPNDDVRFQVISYPQDRQPDSSEPGDYRYYHIVPSRWHACHEHEAFLKSGFPHVHLRLPVVDEEYSSFSSSSCLCQKCQGSSGLQVSE